MTILSALYIGGKAFSFRAKRKHRVKCRSIQTHNTCMGFVPDLANRVVALLDVVVARVGGGGVARGVARVQDVGDVRCNLRSTAL